jgi:regulator of extracellular matrix RemA (YlzA/DUF370 family)
MKKLLLSMMCAAAVAAGYADSSWNINFGDNNVSGKFPSTASTSETTVTIDSLGGNFVVRNVQAYTKDGYLMLKGKSTADTVKGFITMPAMTFDATKITVTSRSNASKNAKLTFYANGDSISTMLADTTSYEFSFAIPEAYQKAGTIYQLMAAKGVNYNAQASKITITGAGATTEPTEPTDTTATVTYPTVASLSAWLEQQPSTDTQITGAVSVIYQSGANMWITDGSAFTYVYGKLSNTYKNGDQLTGIVGKAQNYNNLIELIPVADSFGTATAGEEVKPVTITASYLTSDHQSEYVTLKNWKVSAVSGKTITCTASTDTITVYNSLGVAGLVEGAEIEDMTGFISVFNETVQFVPASINVKVTLSGDGQAKTSAYTVTDILSGGIESGTKGWVKAYIVGAANGTSASAAAFGTETTYTYDSNIIIADDPTCTTTDKATFVQLPSGDVRSNLNLKENKDNIGKQVWLYGSIEKYFGQMGVKSVTKYSWIEGEETVTYPTTETLADWIDDQPTANTQITGTVTAVYQNGKDLFITDGTTSALVYGTLSNTYNNGDQLTGIAGKYSTYNNMPEFIPVDDTFGTATAGTAVDPTEATTADINGNNVAKYVLLKDVKLEGDSISDDHGSVAIYNRYGVTLPEGPIVSITGFVYALTNEMAVAITEIVESDASSIKEISTEAKRSGAIFDLQGRRVDNATRGIYIVDGKKVLIK